MRRCCLVLLWVCAACGAPPADDPQLVATLVRSWYGVARVERLSPPVTSRLLAYHAAALYAGLVAADPAAVAPFGALNDAPALPPSTEPLDGTWTAIAALRVVSDSLLTEALPTTRAALTRLADSLADARTAVRGGGRTRARAEAHGAAIGRAVVAWARRDGFAETRGRAYEPPAGPGRWINDAPANVFATQKTSGASETVFLEDPTNTLRAGSTSDRALVLSRAKSRGAGTLPAVNMAGASEPYWGALRPFALGRWDACPVPPPPAYATARGTPLREAAETVVATQRMLTEAQRATALYWADNAGESGTPAGHWAAIASAAAAAHGRSARDAAGVVFATSVAVADAFIAAWGYKYRDVTIRPRTYIRRVIDPRWEPVIPTPPFPEHPAGHATQSAAAAAVLTARLGDGPFIDSTSVALGHPPRRYASFIAAADEAAVSRLYGGIHFPTGNEAGRLLGACIGRVVAAAGIGVTP
ncbi:MAG: hypothetical protein RL139_276 [Gemmatimonadota bacterium]